MREAPVLVMVIAERNSAVDSQESGLGNVINPLLNDASVFPALSRKVSSVWHVTLNELVELPPVRKRHVKSRTVKSVDPESSPCFAARSVVKVDVGVYADRLTSSVLPVLVKKLPAVMVFSFPARSVVRLEVGVYTVNIKLICTAFSHNEASKLIVFPTMDIEAPAVNVSCFPFNNPCIWLVVL